MKNIIGMAVICFALAGCTDPEGRQRFYLITDSPTFTSVVTRGRRALRMTITLLSSMQLHQQESK